MQKPSRDSKLNNILEVLPEPEGGMQGETEQQNIGYEQRSKK
jgi:hypothetical protein